MQLHAFLTSVLRGREWSAALPEERNPVLAAHGSGLARAATPSKKLQETTHRVRGLCNETIVDNF
jgi:hypothetical protein